MTKNNMFVMYEKFLATNLWSPRTTLDVTSSPLAVQVVWYQRETIHYNFDPVSFDTVHDQSSDCRNTTEDTDQ